MIYNYYDRLVNDFIIIMTRKQTDWPILQGAWAIPASQSHGSYLIYKLLACSRHAHNVVDWLD